MRAKRTAPSERDPAGSRDALAVTSKGTLLVNAMCFDGVSTPAEALAMASQAGAACFVGVVLSSAEARKTLDEVEQSARESAALRLGARQRAAHANRSRRR